MAEVKIVPVRLVNDYEKHFAEAFQEVVKLSLDTFKERGWHGASLDAYKKYKKALKRFSNYPFMKPLMSRIQEWDKELIDLFQSKRQPEKKSEDIKQASANLTKLFMSGNIADAYNYSKSVEEMIDRTKSRGSRPEDIIKKKRNPLYIENPLFFGREGLLEQFTKEDMLAIVEKDLDVYEWTYMPLPAEKAANFEFIVHWIQQLKNTSEPVKLTAKLFNAYSEYAYDSNEFSKIKELVKEYLHGNNKKIIPEILNQLERIPDLKRTNDDQKKSITTVYRGLAIDEDTTEDDIIKMEHKNRYVATSESRYVAERFSFQIGHLESRSARRSDYGAIITYKVTPADILLDTRIFGGIFGESEILIDATKASIDEIEFNEREENEDDY